MRFIESEPPARPAWVTEECVLLSGSKSPQTLRGLLRFFEKYHRLKRLKERRAGDTSAFKEPPGATIKWRPRSTPRDE